MMYSPLLSSALTNLVDKFGINTDAFLAHAIAFTILVIIVVKFGIKPIAAQLEERRKRIEEGEQMRAESEKILADVKHAGDGIMAEAREKSEQQIEHAREIANNIQDEATTRASNEAQNIINNARKQAELESQQQRDALRADFTRLVAEATTQVTGKVLSDNDHRLINEEAIKQL